jgi:aspartate ammonia-lyase
MSCAHLSRLVGEDVVPAGDLIEATQDCGSFVQISGILKRVAVKLSKTCNDLRLTSSGPLRRPRGDQPAAGPSRVLDHARQGQPGHP